MRECGAGPVMAILLVCCLAGHPSCPQLGGAPPLPPSHCPLPRLSAAPPLPTSSQDFGLVAFARKKSQQPSSDQQLGGRTDQQLLSGRTGTYTHMAPEVFNCQKYDEKVGVRCREHTHVYNCRTAGLHGFLLLT